MDFENTPALEKEYIQLLEKINSIKRKNRIINLFNKLYGHDKTFADFYKYIKLVNFKVFNVMSSRNRHHF